MEHQSILKIENELNKRAIKKTKKNNSQRNNRRKTSHKKGGSISTGIAVPSYKQLWNNQ